MKKQIKKKFKADVAKHLKEDMKESRESIKEDKQLMKKAKKKG